MPKFTSRFGVHVLDFRPLDSRGGVETALHTIGPLEEIALLCLWKRAFVELPAAVLRS